ncbi:cytochrome P450 2J5-like [Heteronotia binoei]|uniref:cytochrome P450 2J5-like n=1 Tax=Heteronotia binoei TaxID=13085 RepID=UPI0029306AB8|nr:cytochrome P450 2J5-like [Heteronotia binoei]
MWIRAILGAVLVCLLILHFLKRLQTQKNYPPGPPLYITALRFIQAGFRIQPDTFTKLAKEYGTIYSVWEDSVPVIVVSGYESIKEVLIKHSEEFSGRSITPFYRDVVGDKGIVASNGHIWEQHRKFGLVTLRKLGLGKKVLQRQIEDLALQLAETFARENGQPFEPSVHFFSSVSNVICALVFGHQYSLDDEEFVKLMHALNYGVHFGGTFFHLLYEAAPWLMKHIKGPYKGVYAAADVIFAQARKEIEMHKTKLAGNDPRDFIDYYLLQIEEQSKNDPASTYDTETLVHCISEFLFAGTETVNATLQWGLLLMVHHPDIQEKVQKEMEDAFGSSRSINYEDRKKLPYTLAVINEIQRFKYILVASTPRECIKDVTVLGFSVPKGALIIPNIHSILYDSKVWETPEKFNPNHFLDKDGKFVAREELLIFGAGSRECLAKNLAQMELFYFFTILLKAFTFKLPEGVTEVNLEPVGGVIFCPQHYKICALPRVH